MQRIKEIDSKQDF
jgi:hypothetical protein